MGMGNYGEKYITSRRDTVLVGGRSDFNGGLVKISCEAEQLSPADAREIARMLNAAADAAEGKEG